MKNFAELFAQLDASTSNNAKLSALQDYFQHAEPEDSAWAVYFLAGGKPKRLVPTKVLRQLILDVDAVPEWMFDECYEAVGDLAETISLLLPQSHHQSTEGLAHWVENKLLPLRNMSIEQLSARLLSLLDELDQQSQLVFIKLITGSFRVGVSKLTVIKALSAISGGDHKRIAQRLVGYTDQTSRATAENYQRLIAPVIEGNSDERDAGQPYPFFLAHPVTHAAGDFESQLGPSSDWLIEWKWDGIRAQLVKRDGQIWIWSRGEELITDRFPELSALAEHLPNGTVLDGEIVVWKEDRVQAFALLQQRIGRKTLTPALLLKIPVVFLVYDLLEWQEKDLRLLPQVSRRVQLEKMVSDCAQPTLIISPLLEGNRWQDFEKHREDSRMLGVEGLMLKNKQSFYGVGRTKKDGVWWKWKVDPFTVDAVLIYAQRGHGRRASLYTDFTFAVWDDDIITGNRKLVPFAKAYSGLTDIEMRQIDAIIRKTTKEKFGPVLSVTPTMVFELGFEGIALSSRHKSGIAVRFPRILRWRQDKPLAEADTLAGLQNLLSQANQVRVDITQ
jgi:DNA ligase 1